MSLSSVVFPAPESPVRKVNEPASRTKVTSRRTSGPAPYRIPTFSKRTMGLDHKGRIGTKETGALYAANASPGRLARPSRLKLFFLSSETLADMILTCPQCATRYQVDGAKFPAAGRNVRCAKCGNVWHQLGPVPEPDPEAELMMEPERPAPR